MKPSKQPQHMRTFKCARSSLSDSSATQKHAIEFSRWCKNNFRVQKVYFFFSILLQARLQHESLQTEPEKQMQEARTLEQTDLVMQELYTRHPARIFTIRIHKLRNPRVTNSCTSPVPPIWSCWAPVGRKWVSPSGTFLKRSGNFCAALERSALTWTKN